MFEDRYDEDYCRRIAPWVKSKLDRLFSSIEFSPESIKRIRKVKDHPLMYVALHKSHLDYVVIDYSLFVNDLPFPRTVAGENLLTGTIGNVIKTAFVDFIKAGAVPIKRTGTPEDLITTRDTLEEILCAKKSVLLFPEVTEINGKAKTGRSYDGNSHAFASAFFSAPINASNTLADDVYIIPVSAVYDFVPEDRLFPKLVQAAASRASENEYERKNAEKDYRYLESGFFLRLANPLNILKQDLGKVRVNVGEPILIDKQSRKELAKICRAECEKLYVPTPVSLICSALANGTYSHHRILNYCDRATEQLAKNGIVIPNIERGPFKKTIKAMRERSMLVYDFVGVDFFDDFAVRYYANTIAHHFK